MKKVKLCPSCGKYNNKIHDKCTDCGFVLDSKILLVEDGLERDPYFQFKVFEEKNNEPIPSELNKVKICPVCNTENLENAEICRNCNKILLSIEPVNKKVNHNYKIKMNNSNFIIELEVNNEPLIFGRDFSTNEFITNYRTISRQHFKYYSRDNLIFVEDLSTNGTFINGIRLSKGIPFELHNQDQLKLADLVCEVTIC